jgi:hypothetical protein
MYPYYISLCDVFSVQLWLENVWPFKGETSALIFGCIVTCTEGGYCICVSSILEQYIML